MELENKFPQMVRESGLKQKFIAEKVGISQSTMSGIMQGNLPELPNALKLARFFGRPVEEIWILKPEEGTLDGEVKK